MYDCSISFVFSIVLCIFAGTTVVIQQGARCALQYKILEKASACSIVCAVIKIKQTDVKVDPNIV